MSKSNEFSKEYNTFSLSENTTHKQKTTQLSNLSNEGKNFELKLLPIYIDNNVNISNKYFIFNFKKNDLLKTKNVYLKYFTLESSNVRNNIIFKGLQNNTNKTNYKSLVFQYLLQKYYRNNNQNQLKYLCNIREIGKIINIINNKKISYPSSLNMYCIMDNCGEKLVNIANNPVFNGTPLEALKFIVTVLRECLSALQLLHNLNYLYLNSTPENYLFRKDESGNIQVKIINFVINNIYITF
jgi:hypothetical protein